MNNKTRVIAVFGILLCMTVAVCFQANLEALPASAPVSEKPTVIIDAGHGGADGGAVGVNDIVEKDINLAIALKLRTLLEISGYEVIMIRETDISVHDEGVEGLRRQKTSDLNNRLQAIRDNPGAIFISIHQNKFEQSKYSGGQMFYTPKDSDSQLLAIILQGKFSSMLQPGNTRQAKEADDNLYLIYNSPNTAVLVECGFLSNPEEAANLNNDEYQNKVVFTIFAGLIEYRETQLYIA